MVNLVIEIIKAIILGVVEGFTEFLPISSTGHLLLINQFITFDRNFTILFDIVIQLGAILAVLIFFWNKLWPFKKEKEERKEAMNIWYKTIVGVIPAVILGALFARTIQEKLFYPEVVAIMLFLGGLIIIWVERKSHNSKILSIKDLSFKTAFLIGLIQCLAMIPGTSRSAATIIGAILLGTSRFVATEFSFFLAIPTMIAASVYSLYKYGFIINGLQLVILSVGFIISFLVALIAIKLLMNYIKENSFRFFGYYRIILGALILIYFLIK